jgi:hypothetical protein
VKEKAFNEMRFERGLSAPNAAVSLRKQELLKLIRVGAVLAMISDRDSEAEQE